MRRRRLDLSDALGWHVLALRRLRFFDYDCSTGAVLYLLALRSSYRVRASISLSVTSPVRDVT